MIDQGWMLDDGPDEDDIWDDDPYDDDREPDEPDCCWFGTCSWCRPPFGRARRQLARLWRMQRQRQRKTQRHANDRFWQARNRPVFDDEAPF